MRGDEPDRVGDLFADRTRRAVSQSASRADERRKSFAERGVGGRQL